MWFRYFLSLLQIYKIFAPLSIADGRKINNSAQKSLIANADYTIVCADRMIVIGDRTIGNADSSLIRAECISFAS